MFYFVAKPEGYFVLSDAGEKLVSWQVKYITLCRVKVAKGHFRILAFIVNLMINL